jgi:hypothetical protein
MFCDRFLDKLKLEKRFVCLEWHGKIEFSRWINLSQSRPVILKLAQGMMKIGQWRDIQKALNFNRDFLTFPLCTETSWGRP